MLKLTKSMGIYPGRYKYFDIVWVKGTDPKVLEGRLSVQKIRLPSIFYGSTLTKL